MYDESSSRFWVECDDIAEAGCIMKFAKLGELHFRTDSIVWRLFKVCDFDRNASICARHYPANLNVNQQERSKSDLR